MKRRQPALVAIAAMCLAALSPLTATDGQAQPARPPAATAADLYDLQRDERLGGHTLARHVGLTDRDLAARLRREPRISAASTFPDEITARRVVAAALRQARSRVTSWERRQGTRPNLVLNYSAPRDQPVGRSLRRSAPAAVDCSRALVVLRWLDRERRWIVLTSYPEDR